MKNPSPIDVSRKRISIRGKLELEDDNRSIQLSKVMLGEGQDEVYFFDALLRQLQITDIEVREVGGKEQFKNKLPALTRMTGFSDVKTLAVILDADDNVDAAFKRAVRILADENLEPPKQPNQFSEGNPRIGIFIMPDNSKKGMLEDLCLKTVENKPAMECVDTFIECIVSELECHPSNMAKAKVQSFLAAMPKITKSLGMGAQKGYWDFDSDELTELIAFIDDLKGVSKKPKTRK